MVGNGLTAIDILYLVPCCIAFSIALSAAFIIALGSDRGRSYFTDHGRLYFVLIGSVLISFFYIERMTDWIFTARTHQETITFNAAWLIYHLLAELWVLSLHHHIFCQVKAWRGRERDSSFGQTHALARGA